MSGLAIASIAVGVLVVAVRAPLVFAPGATLTAYRWLLATDLRARSLGVCVALVGLALALPARAVEGGAAALVGGLGWLMLVLGVGFLLAFPRVYRALAGSVLTAIEGAARPVGFLGAAIGVVFVYLGVAVF